MCLLTDWRLRLCISDCDIMLWWWLKDKKENVLHYMERRHKRVFDFHYDMYYMLSGELRKKERRKYKRVVNKRKTWKGEGIYPSALIRACSRFALMRFPACYSGWRASPATRFPWLCHDSVANTLQHSAQRSTLSHSLTHAAFYYNYFPINMILLQIIGVEKQ